jgi:hypothetical protein
VTEASSASVSIQRGFHELSCTRTTHHGEPENESYAVVPSSTPTTANSPGAIGVPATPESGSRSTSWPSAGRRPRGESRAASEENTSKPSARPNQRDP